MKGDGGQPVRLGVIGLGPNWRRYRRALQGERRRFTIQTLYDQVHQRAVTQATRLDARAAESLHELLTADDVDAVLLADEQWYQLWPLELAARTGKPVLCLPPLTGDRCFPAEAASPSSLPQVDVEPRVFFGFWSRFCPATLRLRQLLRSRLGPAQLVLCDAAQADRAEAIDLCIQLTGGKPVRVQSIKAGAGVETCLIEFDAQDARSVGSLRLLGGPRSAQRCRGPRVLVMAQRGEACVRLPRSISWRPRTRKRACREQFMMKGPVERLLLLRFDRWLRGDEAAVAGIAEARRVLQIAGALEQSLGEGKPIVL